MTITITGRSGTRSEAIVEALAEAIDAGDLVPGERLPTHRAMARQLGVSLGTVTRAYAIAEQRGLIVGEVGRGTFVRHLAQAQGESFQRFLNHRAQIDLSMNYPVRVAAIDKRVAASLCASLGGALLADLLAGAAGSVQERHQQAGARWMQPVLPDAAADRTLLGTGAVTSIISAMRHLARRGDVIAVESMTHIQMSSIAERLGLRLSRVAMDEEGMIPESLEQLLCSESVKAVYCQPTIHCASAVTMPARRREAIAEIIRAHDVALIEDDEHFGILDKPLPAISSMLPNQGIFIADLSRAFGLGLRISYVHVPPAMRAPIAEQLIGTVWMVPPLMAELAAQLIDHAMRRELIRSHREEVVARHAMADGVLERWLDRSRDRAAHHAWLPLPRPWRAEQFVAAALGAGVAVTPAAGFIPDGGASPNAIRICMGAAPDRATLEDGLRRLAALLDGETIASRGQV